MESGELKLTIARQIYGLPNVKAYNLAKELLRPLFGSEKKFLASDMNFLVRAYPHDVLSEIFGINEKVIE